ncbi:MAG: glycogen debranching enzyme, partial [Actinomycetota bacterium]|nr:glycogen debranching enzyme [Actinomycetota bacterium]
SWYDWGTVERREDLVEFTRRLIRLRKDHPVFRRSEFLEGVEHEGSGLPDVWWFRTDGHKMTGKDWDAGANRVLGMFLNGEEIRTRTERGERIADDCFVLLFNAHHEDVTFTLPNRRFGERWALELSTADPELEPGTVTAEALSEVAVSSRSMLVLKRA